MSVQLRIGTNKSQLLLSNVGRFDNLVDIQSIKLASSLEARGTTLSFTLYLYDNYFSNIPVLPLEGNEVILGLNNNIIFGGTLIAVNRELGEGGISELIYHCTCIDYTYLLNRKLVNNAYDSQRPNEMMFKILKDLHTRNTADKHYKEFYNSASTLDVTSAGVANDTTIPTIRRQQFDRVPVSDAFDTIAGAANVQWWVDENKHIHMEDVNTINPPLSLNTLDIDRDETTYFDWEEEGDVSKVGNQSVLKDASIKETTIRVNVFDYASLNKRNTANWYTVETDARPFSHLDIISITKYSTLSTYTGGGSGTALTYKIEGYTTGRIPGSLTNSQVGVRLRDNDAVLYIHSTQLSSGNVLVISYNSVYEDDFEGVESASFREMAARTGGDGIHEFVFTQASSLEVSSITDLDQLTAELLQLKSRVPLYRGKFTTLQTNPTLIWRPGQVFQRQLQRAGVQQGPIQSIPQAQILKPQNMYVIKVNSEILRAGESGTPGVSTILKSIVTYSSVPRGLIV